MVNQVNQCSACVCVCVCVCVCGPTAAWTEHTHRHSGLPLPPDVVDRLMKQGQLEVGWRVRVAKTPHRAAIVSLVCTATRTASIHIRKASLMLTAFDG